MNQSSVKEFSLELVSFLSRWFEQHGASESVFPQLLTILMLTLSSYLISRFYISPLIDAKVEESSEQARLKRIFLNLIKNICTPFLSLLLVVIAHGVAKHYGYHVWWLHIARVLLAAWVFSGLVTSSIAFQFQVTPSKTLIMLISLTIWLVAALEVSHLLNPATALLDEISIKLGSINISLLHLIKAFLIMVIFLWLGRTVTSSFSGWIVTSPRMSPALQVLTEKAFKVTFYTVGVVAVLGGLGIDLTSLAWFSGAVGLGVGFGLQKVISNLASGFIILVDRSVKPGDVIQLEDNTYGWINHLGSRYVSLITRDGIEHIIPNEDFITGRVVNWSYSHENVRLKIPIGVSYATNLQLAMEIMTEAARSMPRVLNTPEPTCRLIEFADNSINLELRLWIADPKRGVVGLKSDILLEVWKKFKENGIEIPFPQRVLYHNFSDKETPEIRVEIPKPNEDDPIRNT